MVSAKARVVKVFPLSRASKPAYTLEYRNDTGKGTPVQPSGTPSSDDDDDAPDGWREWRRTQEATHAAQDDGAGVGDDVRYWREAAFDDMFHAGLASQVTHRPQVLKNLTSIILLPGMMTMMIVKMKMSLLKQ